MQSDLAQIVEQIATHPVFVQLKEVVEHFPGWHVHESVFDHSIKTKGIALEHRTGLFITNVQAKKLFLEWMDEAVFGMKRRDVAVLIAILHDCGKGLSYREEGKVYPLQTSFPGSADKTMFSNHEYWGGAVAVPEILKAVQMDSRLKEYIAKMVKLHGTFNMFFPGKEDWDRKEIMDVVKSSAEGEYKAAMFNSYCDCFTASAFAYSKRKIEEVFNDPELFVPRSYIIS